MNFGSYKDDIVLIASSVVNHLTPGTDGTRPYVVPEDAAGRRTRARQVAALADARLGADALTGLVELAAALRPVFERCEHGDWDGAATAVNALLTDYRAAPTLIRTDGDGWHLHFHSRHAGFAESWAAPCATGLAMVLDAGEGGRLGVCTATPCDRVFVDTSRNATRRFCSMRCTNRAGVAAHRARQPR